MEIPAERMRRSVRIVHETEERMRHGVVDALADMVGREIAEELAAAVYRGMGPVQQLTPRELALLAEAQEANGFAK